MINFIEKKISRILQLLKIFYWKCKFGKRIKIGKNFRFRKRLNIVIEKDGYLEIGNNNFFNNDCSICCVNKIVIKDNNMFGENVKIYDHNHYFKDINKIIDTYKTSEIIIGDFNWIGTNAVILKNASINNRNVIGAGVILDKDIDCDTIIKVEDSRYITKKIIRNET